jgi:geranylgeranyl diphosphate/geranylgeranyl-bacteriochlorophyllide a reductase
MNPKVDVAVVGGGPAGATVAHRLAAGGAIVAIFDHSHPREKVCGGGISARAQAMFPELRDLAEHGKHGGSLRLVSPSGYTSTVAGDGQTFAIDRTVLDRALLDRAVAAGADWRQQKVLGIERVDAGYEVATAHRTIVARLVVGADGVHSLVRRKVLAPIPKEHLALGAHALVEGLNPPTALIKFLGDRRGYAWIFNRKNRSSVGIGMPQTRSERWADMLGEFFARHAPDDATLPPIQGWVLPQASDASFFAPPIAGDDWVLVGDAAGHVNPFSGEGILYAMWGAELAAQAILAGRPADFDRAWREAYLARFEKNIRLARILEQSERLDAIVLAGKLPGVRSLLFKKIAGG